VIKQYGIVVVAVTELIVTVVACVWAGGWLDKRFELKGLGLALGSILGFLGGSVRLYFSLRKLMDKND
jgi:F0F1-type ATP synthase assembly protein I